MAKKKQLTDEEIKKSLLKSLKYIGANVMTSALIFALIFIITIIIGLESPDSMIFLRGSTFQTIMLPFIVTYYGFLAYNEGYKDSVSGIYNKNKILLAALPIFAIQIIFALAAVAEGTEAEEMGIAKTVAMFLMSPFAILFNSFSDLMPELMIFPTVVPPAAMYLGYYFARFKEVKDHSMKEDAMAFRKRMEEIQYERKFTDDGDKK